MAESPDLSPTKKLPIKKHYGAGTCSPTADYSHPPTLAAYPTTEKPALEHSLKAMFLSLQTELQRDLRDSINNMHDKNNMLRITHRSNRTTPLGHH